jgi:hypothetical protein
MKSMFDDNSAHSLKTAKGCTVLCSAVSLFICTSLRRHEPCCHLVKQQITRHEPCCHTVKQQITLAMYNSIYNLIQKSLHTTRIKLLITFVLSLGYIISKQHHFDQASEVHIPFAP